MPKRTRKLNKEGSNYNPGIIESKWQKYWEKSKTFKACDASKKPKFYCLDMFPYPSAYGIHVGHLKGYSLSDVVAKKKKMEGFEVLHPMGFDAFGLPAENFAIKTGVHPLQTTKKAIKNIKNQLRAAGFGYDWEREIITCEKDYYRWTQWMFLKLYEAGLAYRKKSPVNFCPSCKTVLANEQVVDGKCERCSSQVEKKYLEQWFFKITDYAKELLGDLDKIDWPERIKIMQKNWIGRSEGTEILFAYAMNLPQKSTGPKALKVFTTRVDTLFGCTYVVVAPEHPLIEEVKPFIQNPEEVEKYVQEALKKSEIERAAQDKEKTGTELKGFKVINPVNNREVPVFVSDYVLTDYGTGAIMAVPAHDQRDYLFAKRHNLSVMEVIRPKNQVQANERAFEEDGILFNSEVFSGMESAQARKEITKYLEKRKQGKKTVNYKLRDWLISRQRYWGAPIPMVFCSKCGWQPIKEKDLPVVLPKIKEFLPLGEGKSPLERSKAFVSAKCPKCQGKARRETDTMDTFVCSSWYFLRYADPKNTKKFAGSQKINRWLPVDFYVGGVEHAVLHLLYSRFFVKALKDKGYLDFEEPFLKLFNQGIIYYQGAKMSKSKGNVINPDDIIKRYGADTMRLYELFMGPMDQAGEWSDKGVVGVFRFLNRIWNLQFKLSDDEPSPGLKNLLHKTIKKTGEEIEECKMNTAISSLMIFLNELEKENLIPRECYLKLIALLAPMAPHISEEIWQRMGGKPSIFNEPWPCYDPELAKDEEITLIVQVNGKVRDKIILSSQTSQEKAIELAKSSLIVQKWIGNKPVKKVVYVKDRLINFVL